MKHSGRWVALAFVGVAASQGTALASETAAPNRPESDAAGAGMVEIPGAAFLMGAYLGEGPNEERPAHEVMMPTYWIDSTEVTVEAYRSCVEAGRCVRPHVDKMCNFDGNPTPYGDADRSKHPINCVDLNMAEAYCAYVDKRLPTEREWEFAARGGAEHRRFSWGADDPSAKNACYAHIGGTCKVASYAPGAFGLYDMAGNVWEWTASKYGPYPYEATQGDHYVYRGGSWSRRFPHWLAGGMRNRYRRGEFSASLGFRCAKSTPELHCPTESSPKDGACMRTSGMPLCEPGADWDGKACVHNWVGVASARSTTEGATSAKADGDAKPSDPSVIARTRTPGDDADCAAHYKGKAQAYRFSGGTFYSRNPTIAAAGCTRRVMGQTWTSVCCPGGG